MPQVINLDAVTWDMVEVQKTVAGVPRVWHLRDDVSAETMIRFFELAQASAEGPDAPVGVVDAFRAADRIYTSVLVDIVRHTYPEPSAAETEADLRAAFSYEERKRLVDLFFSLAGIALNEPSSAALNSTATPATSTDPSTASSATAAEGVKPNRAARRAKGKPQSS